MESKMVNAHLQPSQMLSQTFHIYNLISSLQQAHVGCNIILPLHGFSILMALKIGTLTYCLFAMMDITEDFQDTKSWCSILGSQLKQWSMLPDSPLVHHIWQEHPQNASYQWMLSLLQALLLITQAWWVKCLHYHPIKGSFEAHDANGDQHLLFDSHVLLSLIPHS
jgi:hypothetical protein